MNPRQLMTVAEAADYLNLSPKALRRRIDRRAVPIVRLGPRTIRLSQLTLDVWMRESERYAERRSA
jgi:excisionase family DNA binding protein